MQTNDMIEKIAERILEQGEGFRFFRVAFDGVDTAGKTFLANSLASHPLLAERPIIRASIDGFHNPRDVRYLKGRRSPEGYYRNSFNNNQLRVKLLEPLSPTGSGEYQKNVFDYRVDQETEPLVEKAPEGSILLFDGVFLGRPELSDCWEMRIFLRVSFEEMLRRATQRDTFMGSSEEITSVYKERYIPGQQIYFDEAHPEQTSDIVIDNEDYANPNFVRI